MKAIKERKTCPYCAIFAKEKASSRLIFGNNEFIAFAPYYLKCGFFPGDM
jgi:galactose-1-phosphate uridylyltransferase